MTTRSSTEVTNIRMQKRVWIRENDIVLVEPWDWQDEKADITWRYENSEAEQLREEGHLQ
jgi:Translation initiation factor 1 (IF-1)